MPETVRVLCPMLGHSEAVQFMDQCQLCGALNGGPGNSFDATLAPGEAERIARESAIYRRLLAQVMEALAILDAGSDYDRLHLTGILRAGFTPTPPRAGTEEA